MSPRSSQRAYQARFSDRAQVVLAGDVELVTARDRMLTELRELMTDSQRARLDELVRDGGFGPGGPGGTRGPGVGPPWRRNGPGGSP